MNNDYKDNERYNKLDSKLDKQQYDERDESQFPEDDYLYEEAPNNNRAIRGYQILIVLLAVVLVVLSFAYLRIHRENRAENELLMQDKTTMQVELDSLIVALDGKEFQNDTIAARLEEARQLVEDLKRERTLNYNKLRQYQKEVGTLRTIMQGYLRQIDSLNNVNAKLTKENIAIKKEISTERLRAEMAEEKAEELDNMVKVGSVLKAGQISMKIFNKREKEVTRIKNATQARVDFFLGGNNLAEPGQKTIYLCIYSPEGYVLANPDAASFSFEGEPKVYSAKRDVDYQNEDLGVSIYYKSEGMSEGTYRIELYCEGRLIGSGEQSFK